MRSSAPPALADSAPLSASSLIDRVFEEARASIQVPGVSTEFLPLLTARRTSAKTAPRPGRPPGFVASFEAAYNLAQLAVIATAIDRGSSWDSDALPSGEDLSTWDAIASKLKLTPWQIRRACLDAINDGPRPVLPTGANFLQSRTVRPGLSLLIRNNVYSPDDIEELVGVKREQVILNAEADLEDVFLQWGRSRGKAGGRVVDECRKLFAPGEAETAAFMVAVSSGTHKLLYVPWVAVCGALRRVAMTRQAYVSMPLTLLTKGDLVEANKRLAVRHAALQDYVVASLRAWSAGYAALDLGDLLSDVNMNALRERMRYGAETSNLQLRREVLFSRLGVIDRFVVGQLQGDANRVAYPLEIDQKGEVPAHVSEALAPLFEVGTGLTNNATGRPLEGQELFLSEVLTDRPWEARQALLRGVFDAALSPWSW